MAFRFFDGTGGRINQDAATAVPAWTRESVGGRCAAPDVREVLGCEPGASGRPTGRVQAQGD
jgi:hypothetical protein